MFIPSSTYRVQLHKNFNFSDLESILDYLFDLGVTTIYAAPILKAKAGSMHGYDVVDPHVINPEIGTLTQFRKLIAKVKQKDMTWIQDIVPNHMAFHETNDRLMDVLERGEDSSYHNYFDVDWDHRDIGLQGKIQVPFLGKPLDDCLAEGEVRIEFTPRGFVVTYFDSSYPLSPQGVKRMLSGSPVLKAINIPEPRGKSMDEWRQLKNECIEMVLDDELKFQCVIEAVEHINRDIGKLREILSTEHYVLTYWKETEKRINYRRFFTVNELICLRMEEEAVFDEYHSFIHKLYEEGLIQGIRIDHIDGLHDPLEYLKRLRDLFGPDCYIIAEKILEAKEGLPADWPIEGTSGYEFLSYVSQLMTSRKGARELVTFYKTLIPGQLEYKDLVIRNKWMILENYMAGEWDNLVSSMASAGLINGFAKAKMKMALGWLMVSLPVYRIYPSALPLTGENKLVINEAFQKVLASADGFQLELKYLKHVLVDGADDVDPVGVLQFLKRLMQFTGPLTAKGVEDTTFYVYNALISHDEVGDAPSSLGVSIGEFHRRMMNRQLTTPLSLNTTATHDTKRGEDSRIRLNVLCDYPGLWRKHVEEWIRHHSKIKKKTSSGVLAPTLNDEYYIYQSIVGGFPENFEVTHEFVTRVIEYHTKVLREAKVNTDWSSPDEEYEMACREFIKNILVPDSLFVNGVTSLLHVISNLAWRYSIAQSLIKITTPGIPDTYQGGSLWDLSFVDPDNRRPVDYSKRTIFLSQMEEKSLADSHELFLWLEDHRQEGAEKLFVTWKALNFRKQHPELFVKGNYLALQVSGDELVTVAFARHYDGKWLLIIAPLRVKDRKDQTDLMTGDTVILPDGAPTTWRNVFTDEIIESDGTLPLANCFNRFALAMLINE